MIDLQRLGLGDFWSKKETVVDRDRELKDKNER